MSKSKSPKFSVRDFFVRFPDDDACLNHIMEVRFGMKHPCRKCMNVATFHRLKGVRAFSCSYCGDHVHPTAGTVFEDTRTPLVSWFYAIYLFVTTRHGVSGKELQRQLGVTYKTAYRMGMKIRELIGSTQDFDMLQGHVEIDEAYVGGRRSGGKRGMGAPGKTIVMAMKERGGDIRAVVIPNVKMPTLRSIVLRNVKEGSVVSTDELMSYGLLEGDGYKHGTVRHSIKNWNTTTAALARLIRPILSKASGRCSSGRFARRTFTCRQSTCTAIWTNSLFGRTTARCRTRCLIC